MHLASPELCRLVGECLPSNDPPAVFAADAVRALDQAHVSKGVILSCAYPLWHAIASFEAARDRGTNATRK